MGQTQSHPDSDSGGEVQKAVGGLGGPEKTSIADLQPLIYSIAEHLDWKDRVNLKLVCKGAMGSAGNVTQDSVEAVLSASKTGAEASEEESTACGGESNSGDDGISGEESTTTPSKSSASLEKKKSTDGKTESTSSDSKNSSEKQDDGEPAVGRDGGVDLNISSKSLKSDLNKTSQSLKSITSQEDAVNSDLLWWRFLTRRLCAESGLYLPAPTDQQLQCPKYWRKEFLRLFPIRSRFLEEELPEPSLADPLGGLDGLFPGEGNSLRGEKGEETAVSVNQVAEDIVQEGKELIQERKKEEIDRDEEFKIGVYVRIKGGKLGRDPRLELDPETGEPLKKDDGEGDDCEDKAVVLPLHQRVALLRQAYPSISQEEALKAVVRERGQVPVGDKGGAFSGNDARCKAKNGKKNENEGASSSSKGPGDEEVFGSAAGEDTDTLDVQKLAGADPASLRPQILDTTGKSVLAIVPGVGLREFYYDSVFKPENAEHNNQEQVYEQAVRESVGDFLNGSNTSCICYGQTASGKTFTSFGPPDLLGASKKLEGIAPRACREVMEVVRKRRENSSKMKSDANNKNNKTSQGSQEEELITDFSFNNEANPVETPVTDAVTSHQQEQEAYASQGVPGFELCQLSISYVELYGNEVNDLLKGGEIVGQEREGRYSGTRATDRVGHRYVLDGHTAVNVNTYEELEQLLLEGDSAKRRAATAMNARSTRAHTVLILNLAQRREVAVPGASAKAALVSDPRREVVVPGASAKAALVSPSASSSSTSKSSAKAALVSNCEAGSSSSTSNKSGTDQGTATTKKYTTVHSKLFLADLGGAERMSKSKADSSVRAPVMMVGGEEVNRISWHEYYANRKRVQETLLINRGLLALKRVITALNDRVTAWKEWRAKVKGLQQRAIDDGKVVQPMEYYWNLVPPPVVYIPYQDSKLTQILQSSLGGESRTTIICCACPAEWNASESVHTLRFAENCSHVSLQQLRANGNGAESGGGVLDGFKRALATIDSEIDGLEDQIRTKERWETKVVERTDLDTVAGEFGRWWDRTTKTETVKATVLVGAEVEREALEKCLARRKQLMGLASAGLAPGVGGAGGVEGLSKEDQEFLGKDFRGMAYGAEEDKGAKDFRHAARFSKKMVARDFEDLSVVADGLRFLFRKTAFAKQHCKETDETIGKRLPTDHELLAPDTSKYYEIAERMKESYEGKREKGEISVSFGKSTMDFIMEWSKIKDCDAKNVIIEELEVALPLLDRDEI